MGQDCLWNGKEHNIGDLNRPVPWDLHRDKLKQGLNIDMDLILCFSGLYLVLLVQSCTIMKGGADQLGSVNSYLLLAVPEAVLSPSAGLSLRRKLSC